MSENEQFVLYATFQPREGQDEKLLEVTRDSGRNLDGKDGLLSYQLLKPEKPGQPLVFIANWKSKKHFEEAMASPDVREGHSGEKMKEAYHYMLKATAENYCLDALYHQSA